MIAHLATALAADAPEISRSVGPPGGVVVLWPRIIPASTDPAIRLAASQLQARLRATVEQALPGAPIDVRPEPERVCPRQGCAAVAVGAVLTHAQGGCVAVVTVSRPGASSAGLVPWAGVVEPKQPSVPFREPPESQLTIRDFVPCAELAAAAAARDAGVVEAVKAAAVP